MADWNQILFDKEAQPTEDELLNYLENNLSDEEMNEVEQKLANSTFASDAVDGLGAIKQKEKLNEYVQQLNKKLQQQLATKKQRKQKRKLKDNPWILLAIILLLAICIIGFLMVHMHNKKNSQGSTEKQQSSQIILDRSDR